MLSNCTCGPASNNSPFPLSAPPIGQWASWTTWRCCQSKCQYPAQSHLSVGLKEMFWRPLSMHRPCSPAAPAVLWVSVLTMETCLSIRCWAMTAWCLSGTARRTQTPRTRHTPSSCAPHAAPATALPPPSILFLRIRVATETQMQTQTRPLVQPVQAHWRRKTARLPRTPDDKKTSRPLPPLLPGQPRSPWLSPRLLQPSELSLLPRSVNHSLSQL